MIWRRRLIDIKIKGHYACHRVFYAEIRTEFCALICSKNTSQMLIKTRIVLSYFPSGLSAIKTEETRRSPLKDFISVQYNHL